MKHKTSQAGFTLIELIAVMVILGILAAVIIPRITTLTSGAYESNVRSMYGVIKNEVNAQAVKKAMTGGATGHREEYPQITVATANNYLKEWVEDMTTLLDVKIGDLLDYRKSVRKAHLEDREGN